MAVLVALSLSLSLLVFFYLLTHGESFRESLSFTVMLIVASIPMAIEIVRIFELLSFQKHSSLRG
jgi:H+-transporting ATPase